MGGIPTCSAPRNEAVSSGRVLSRVFIFECEVAMPCVGDAVLQEWGRWMGEGREQP